MLFTFQDLAIFSDDITKCEEDIKESQNNKPKFQCVPAFNKKIDHLLPLTEEECDVSIKKTTVEAIPYKSSLLLYGP